MSNILGWKDILRPIRDGYRHLFPSPDTGPTPEERRKQRELDQLKGFAYFDTFGQLQSWTEEEADPLQRSNTPLLPRSQGVQVDGKAKANVLLCHDCSGNYHDYEAVQGVGVDEESYSCEYLQFVETFIYFSHKLACVPPPSWTNALHRNGVNSLGTFLVEPQTKDAEILLQRTSAADGAADAVSFPMARALANVAKHYGFDGWLINIEKPFPNGTWDHTLLEAFLRQLRDDLGTDRQVVWYDAITVANKIDYQNALTTKNVAFSKACGSILTNYCWKEGDVWSSKQLALQHDLPQRNVFFGVDVWAQNTTKLTHPRVTYPEKGGGGTNTGIAVAKLAEVSLSVGVFAPAWSFEHFPKHGRAVERAMWDGYELPESVSCSCGNGKHPPNRGLPITGSARQFPAGSETFFYTDFSRAFGCHEENDRDRLYAGKKLHSQLASQSVLPHWSRLSARADKVESAANVLSQRLEDLPGRTQLVVEAQSVMPRDNTSAENSYERWLRLFKLDMPADGSLLLGIQFRCTLHEPGMSASYYLKFTNGVSFLSLGEKDTVQTIEAIIILDSAGQENGRLQEIGIHLQAPPFGQVPVRVAEVLELRITPRTASELSASHNINDVRVESRGEGDTQHWRLCWTYRDETLDSRREGVPFSETTGPFSHFLVRVDGVEAGKAYALEYILSEVLVERFKGEGVEVVVTGVGFDGRRLVDRSVRLHL